VYPYFPHRDVICTKFRQQEIMIYYWAQYGGFGPGATLQLPQCTNMVFVAMAAAAKVAGS
jgi:hypothetical protein